MSTDIDNQKLIFRRTPPALHPYLKLARLDRPIGTWLLLLPGWWSLVLAARSQPDGLNLHVFTYIALFGLGALLMRGAGCVVNDIWDRKLDAEVERTRTRPLPAGDVTLRQAVGFLAGLLAVSFLILLCFNRLTIALGIASLALVGAYPAMKRITWWPQAFLGLTFNWGALLGWCAVQGSLGLAPLLLYLGGICWTLAYDTIYAHQDKEDDATVGIKSTALLFGEKSKTYVLRFYIAAMALFAAARLAAGFDGRAVAVAVAVPLLACLWRMMKNWNPDDPASSLKAFKANRDFGLIVLLMCLV
jgi:4-hydroxybenzoate polyprenyltransferase